MKKTRILTGGLLAFIVVLLVACTTPTNNEQSNSGVDEVPPSDKLQVTATFYPMYEFASRVAGDLAEVELLVPAGTDTHGYEPSARDIAQLSEADLFVYNSPEMETWVPSVLDVLSESGEVAVVEAASQITLEEPVDGSGHHGGDEHGEDDHHHDLDPHVWLDPVLAQFEVQTIKDAFVEIDPDNREIYEENATEFIGELNQLHSEFQEAFSGAQQRIFVTQHAAFGYLASRYNLLQLSIAGISTENEPSPAQMAQIEQMIHRHNIPVIYKNTDSAGTIADTLAQEAGVEVAELHSLEGVTDEERDAGENYLTIMRKNLEALKQSIQ